MSPPGITLAIVRADQIRFDASDGSEVLTGITTVRSRRRAR